MDAQVQNKEPTEAPARGPVLSYTALIAAVATETGMRKSHVRNCLEAMQRITATHLRDDDARVYLGRFATLTARTTKERVVNNPRSPGARVVSHPHRTVKFTLGLVARMYLTGQRASWDERPKADVPDAVPA